MKRWLLMAGMTLVGAIMGTPGLAAAQGDTSPPEAGKCWRFAFGSWTPPLDWEKAGHTGRATEMADRVQRVRDSVFARDSTATRSRAMYWERTTRGLSVVLFPPWWPVGVLVEFDSVTAAAGEMTGLATALVANAGSETAHTRVRAIRCPASPTGSSDPGSTRYGTPTR